MAGLAKRLENVAGAVDRAVASLFGAKWFQTVSGTVGRACGDGGGDAQAWGPKARALIEVIPLFGAGHCKRWADIEQIVDGLLTPAGLSE